MRQVNHKTRVTMENRRNFVNYATMTLSDGTVLNLTPADFRLSGNSFTDDWCDGDSIQLGAAIGKTVTITLDNTDNRIEDGVIYRHGKFSTYDFYMAYFTLDLVLPNAYVEDDEPQNELIRIGTFTVTEPVSYGTLIEITGVDNMYLFDRSFDECQLDFTNGVTLKQLLTRCCTDCGVSMGSTISGGFNYDTLKVYLKPEGVTYRQVVSYIAQISGHVAIIGGGGTPAEDFVSLQFKWFDMSPLEGLDGGKFDNPDTTTEPYESGDDADGGEFDHPEITDEPYESGYVYDSGEFDDVYNYHNFVSYKNAQISTDDIVFTGLKITGDNIDVHSPSTEGWDTYYMTISDNPFISADNAQEIAGYLYSQISSLLFRPFSNSVLQDPTVEAGDCAFIYDVKGNMYKTIITNVEYTTGGYTNISSKATAPAKQNSRYAVDAKTEASRKVLNYSSQVARFNELANSALGYYKTTEIDDTTHAVTTYIHDMTNLSDSKIVWKITSSGIFITEDYQAVPVVWNNGYDASTGTMLVNLLYVHGLSADWIKTGTLEVGGDNNVDGVIKVYNSLAVGTSQTITSTTKQWFFVGPSQISDTGTYNINYRIYNIEANKDFKLKYEIQYTANGGTSWSVLVASTPLEKTSGTFPITFDVEAGHGEKYYVIGIYKQASSAATVSCALSRKVLNTTIDNTGITTNNIVIRGGSVEGATKIAGLTVENAEHGLSYNQDNRYFKTAAYGMSCGKFQQDSSSPYGGWWTRFDYVPDYALLKVDYGANSGFRGIYVTNAGNNTYYDPGSSYSNLLHDGVHTSSDKRAKTDIKTLDTSFVKSILHNINPVEFKFNDDTEGKLHYGFIAQEVEKIIKNNDSVVAYDKQFDRYSMNYQELIAPLYAIVKIQQEEIEHLKDIVNNPDK